MTKWGQKLVVFSVIVLIGTVLIAKFRQKLSLQIVRVPIVGQAFRWNRLTDREIIGLDNWCGLWQQDGGIRVDGANWTTGWKNGPVFHGASRTEWDNDPRPSPQLVSVPSNWNGTLIGIDPWCYRATEAQLWSARRRRQEAWDRLDKSGMLSGSSRIIVPSVHVVE